MESVFRKPYLKQKSNEINNHGLIIDNTAESIHRVFKRHQYFFHDILKNRCYGFALYIDTLFTDQYFFPTYQVTSPLKRYDFCRQNGNQEFTLLFFGRQFVAGQPKRYH